MSGNGYGFHPNGDSHEALDKEIYEVSMSKVKKFFAPELLGRIDRIVVFRPLSRESLREILNLELKNVQTRLSESGKLIILDISERAKDFLLKESDDAREGARHIKKSIRRFITAKLASLIATRQAEAFDRILVDCESDEELTFYIQKEPPPILLNCVSGVRISPAPPAFGQRLACEQTSNSRCMQLTTNSLRLTCAPHVSMLGTCQR